MSQGFYRAFEERYRGSRKQIKGRLKVYLSFVKPLLRFYSDLTAVDLGCGRGEWIELLQENGFKSHGVDLDEGMLEACVKRNLSAVRGDAIVHLKSLANNSQGVVSAFHVAEHMSFDDLETLVAEARRVLKPGGLLILETPNPENIVVGTTNFYLDPSHLRPIPPLLLSFLAEFNKFSRVKTLRLQEPQHLREREEVELRDVLGGVSPDYAVVAQKKGKAAIMTALDAVFALDYGLSLESLTSHYDMQINSQRAQSETQIQQADVRVQQADVRAQQADVRAQQADVRAQQADVRAQQADDRVQQADDRVQQADDRVQQADDRAQQADVRAQQADDRVQQADVRVQQADARVQQVEIRVQQVVRDAESYRQEAENRVLQASYETSAYRQQAESAQAQVAAFYSSTSWRITRPLRGVKRMLCGDMQFAHEFSAKTILKTKIIARTLVTHGIRYVFLRPRLRRGLSWCLKKVPALHRHLSRIATNTDIDHNISENTSQLSTAEIINTRILQLTTYDIETPNHGGKIRAHQIRRSLRSKFHVETLSFEWSQKDDASSFSVQLNTSRYITEVGNGLLSDWGICQYLDTYPDITEKIFAKIKNYCPDILFVEQPFLWSFVENLIRSGAVPADIFIVYSSHNIESDLKRKIYFDNFQEQDAIRYLDYVDSIEKAIISRSDVVLAVSETDAAYIKEFNRDVPIRVYANGHSRPRLFGAKTEWIKKFRAGGAGPNWVFVGSYHPPNINGLRDFLAAIPPDFDTDKFALWVLGGAGDGLKAMPGFDPLAYPCLHIAGPVSDEDIDSAINTATGILLPIWEGSGSNLKTAQALLSGKCVVATRYAFRGFEHYLNEPGVFTADRAVDLVNLAMTPHLETEYIRERASVELSWDNVLETLPIFTSKHFDNYRIGKNQDCKIVFDCTSIIEWKGQLTGIQRVIVQLGTNLCNLSHYIKLGVFDSHGNCSRYSLADRTIGTQMNIEAGDIILSAGPNWDSMDHHQCLLALRHKGIRLGILYYDTIPYILPLSYGPGFATIYTKWLDDSLRNCDIAFAISENTKRDLISFCSEQKICPPPVSVVRLGDQIEMAGNVTPSELIKEITALPFILSVGTIEYRKNHIVLLNAYRYMLRDQSYKPPKLLIVGRKGWLDSEIAYQVENDPCLKDHIVILQGITDIDLGYLYSNCLFTVYPSIYEGWGLPIAESLNFGKLCIASRSSSMLEIAFDLTRHAHPLLVHEWVNEIRDLLDHPEVLERESERIGREYEPCSWRRSAEQIHAGLCQVFSWLNKE